MLYYIDLYCFMMFYSHVGNWDAVRKFENLLEGQFQRPWAQAGREFEAAGCFKDAAECAEVSRQNKAIIVWVYGASGILASNQARMGYVGPKFNDWWRCFFLGRSSIFHWGWAIIF